MTSSNNVTILTNNVKGLQSSKKRTKLIQYFRSKLSHNGFFNKQRTQLLRTKIHGSMILKDQFSFLMEHLTHVVFQLPTSKKHPLSLKTEN